MPEISVVLPVYNRSRFLGNSLESILNQTFTGFEFIIVDDGSNQDTLEILRSYKKQDSRINLIELPHNVGQSMARAIGNEVATGKYLAIWDSDDIAFSNRFIKQYEYLEEYADITVLGSRAIKVSDTKRVEMKMALEDSELKALLLHVDRTFVHPTVMMRTKFLKENNLNYNSERRGDDDYEFYNRTIDKGAKFANLEDTLVEYHRHDENISSNSPFHFKRKLPLREKLISLYYPDLTSKEVNSLAFILQENLSVNLRQAMAGLLAGEKAVSVMRSYYGEDKKMCNGIISSHSKKLINSINKIVQ